MDVASQRSRVQLAGVSLVLGGMVLCAPLAPAQTEKGFEYSVRRAHEHGLIIHGRVVGIRDVQEPAAGQSSSPVGPTLLYREHKVLVEDCYMDSAGDCYGKQGRFVYVVTPVGVAGAHRDGRGAPSGVGALQTNSTTVAVGTLHRDEELLLFLDTVNPDELRYRVQPVAHAKREVRRVGRHHRVQLAFEAFDLLSDAAKTSPETLALERRREAGESTRPFEETVNLDDLPGLITRVRGPEPPRRRQPSPPPPRR